MKAQLVNTSEPYTIDRWITQDKNGSFNHTNTEAHAADIPEEELYALVYLTHGTKYTIRPYANT